MKPYSHFQTRYELAGSPRWRDRVAGRGLAGVLFGAGVLAVLLSLAGVLGLLASIFGIRPVTVFALYGVSFVALILVTGSGSGGWSLWLVRSLLPLPAAVLIWWILGIFGL